MLTSDRSVGDNVRRLRKLSGLGYRELSRRLEDMGTPIFHNVIPKVESGERPLRVTELQALAEIFDVTPEVLLSHDELHLGAETQHPMMKAARALTAAANAMVVEDLANTNRATGKSNIVDSAARHDFAIAFIRVQTEARAFGLSSGALPPTTPVDVHLQKDGQDVVTVQAADRSVDAMAAALLASPKAMKVIEDAVLIRLRAELPSLKGGSDGER